MFKNVYKKYEGGVTAVSDFNLDIADKEFIILVGPSGCGKTTIIKLVARLFQLTSGKVKNKKTYKVLIHFTYNI